MIRLMPQLLFAQLYIVVFDVAGATVMECLRVEVLPAAQLANWIDHPPTAS